MYFEDLSAFVTLQLHCYWAHFVVYSPLGLDAISTTSAIVIYIQESVYTRVPTRIAILNI